MRYDQKYIWVKLWSHRKFFTTDDKDKFTWILIRLIPGEIAKICCDISSSPHRESENTGNHSHSTTVEPKKPQNVYLHPKFRLLEPELCGRIMPEPKIFGGSDTKLFEYPWMAQLGYIRSNQSKDHHIKEFLCAGTIINKKYVLTAAHCIHHLRDSKFSRGHLYMRRVLSKDYLNSKNSLNIIFKIMIQNLAA